jgi:hypothetical protein
MDLGNGRLGCYQCGSVFISKPVRDYNYSRTIDQLKAQQAEAEDFKLGKTLIEQFPYPPKSVKETEKVRWVCGHVKPDKSPCGFEAKSKAGLGAHMRRCKHENR